MFDSKFDMVLKSDWLKYFPRHVNKKWQTAIIVHQWILISHKTFFVSYFYWLHDLIGAPNSIGWVGCNLILTYSMQKKTTSPDRT